MELLNRLRTRTLGRPVSVPDLGRARIAPIYARLTRESLWQRQIGASQPWRCETAAFRVVQRKIRATLSQI